ncbi:Glutathione S-transferase domain protein [Bibersteinia trehalosi USDA-ARS-USMARC-188]|uniref:Glutathione S-transferase domain protein n=2 Tax=Bibersteinia trehalosi TaxID=47735 RepID=A0A4V7I733_BIBTR|nr:glutathione S-transferase N-terminal domain-containing protein [Bibersteinia trehalosi]AGH39443.1 Glutathione S-transferase domain protein [Bibersteinia trehalosi USDA-ARS-USMARC-192]AHG80812.1 Glutathione S-transferase domain protein [Bibersteinia trehalosi USDA-ARS-USMARC-188]AHG82961.1 Glutathione S-transferase domain protein [Bibersteinia trehalosi USDA-ARS-USMARC-189]
MKLWYSTTSPFVRKVRAVAYFHGLENQIELLQTTKAFALDSGQNAVNPLGKIPALQRDNGKWLFDSSLIAEYLDDLGVQNGSQSLFPQGEDRWDWLNLYKLAEGILENATALMLPEKMFRPENEWWTARHKQVVERNERSLNMVWAAVQAVGFELNIATLYVVCLVDFLNFRFEACGSANYSALAKLSDWAIEMNSRYSCLAQTKPYMA